MFIKPSYIYLSLFCRRCAWRVRVCMDVCVYPPLNFENGVQVDAPSIERRRPSDVAQVAQVASLANWQPGSEPRSRPSF